jgi:hypothetical protein
MVFGQNSEGTGEKIGNSSYGLSFYISNSERLRIGAGKTYVVGNGSGSGLEFRNSAAGWSYGGIYTEDISGWNGALVFTTDGDGVNNNNPTEKMRISPDGNVGIGTTSPYVKFAVSGRIVADSIFATTTATSTFVGGIQTNLLNIVSTTASSSFGNGINLANGCFSINGTCLSTGGSSASSTLLSDFNTFSNTNNFTGSVGFSSTTPFARLSINNTAGENAFAIGSSTGTSFIVDKNGNVGVGTASPDRIFQVASPSAPSNLAFGVDKFGNVTVGSGFQDAASFYANSGTYRVESTGSFGFSASQAYNSSDTALMRNAAGVIEINNGTSGVFADLIARKIGLATTTPFAKLSVNSIAGEPAFVVGSSTRTDFIVDKNGDVGIGTTNLSGFEKLTINGDIAIAPTTGVGGIIWLDSPSTLGNSFFTETVTGRLDIRKDNGGSASISILQTGFVGIATTTPTYLLNPFSSSAPQLALSAGAGLAQIAFRNAGGNFYISSTTVAGTATTSTSLLEIASGGFGTTTIRGLNISGQATSTSNVGFNITNGCFAINGTCVGGSGSSASSTLLSDFNTFSNTNNFTGNVGIGTSSPYARLSVVGEVVARIFTATSTTATSTFSGGLAVGSSALNVLLNGNVGIGTANPISKLYVAGGSVLLDNNNAYQMKNLAGNAVNVATVDGSSNMQFGGAGINVINLGTTDARFGVDNNSSFAFITTSGNERLRVTSAGNVGIGTTTPTYLLNPFSATAPQLALSAGAGLAQWAFRNAGGNFYLSTTTVAGTATTSTSAFTILSSGNVGVGTTSPASALDVAGTLTVGTNTGRASISTWFSNTASWIEMPVSGPSGIGSGGAGGNPWIAYVAGSGQWFTSSVGGDIAYRNTAGRLLFGNTTGSAGMVLTGDNLGIGNYSPLTKLHVGSVSGGSPGSITGNVTLSAGSNMVSNTATDGASITWNANTNGGNTNTIMAQLKPRLDTASNYNLDVFAGTWNNNNSAGTAIATFQSDGEVGIGTTTPRSTLHVVGSASEPSLTANTKSIQTWSWPSGSQLDLTMSNASPYAVSFQTRYSLDSGTTYPMALNPLGGNIGIATTAPWRTFSVTGTVGFDGLTAGAGAGALCLSANKEVTYSAGATCTVSSGQFKHSIATSTSGIDIVNAMRPVTFEYNANIGVPGVQFGFIAEEVELLDPRLVVHDAQGLPISVRYENFTAVLARALQEEDVKINMIDVRLATLESLVTSSTPSTGGIAFSEVLSSLEALGARFVDGIAYLKNVFVENLTIGTPAKPSGITLYDEVTGEPYCLKMRNGAMVSVAGDCAIATSTPIVNITATTTDTISPEISLMGNNPAEIMVGSSYVDLGATVTDMGINPLDPGGPLVLNTNLGLQYSVDGVSVTEISLDTSTSTTHTIVFSAVDQSGNWGYATRTVEVIPQQ